MILTTIGFLFRSNSSKKMFSISSRKEHLTSNINRSLCSKLPLSHVCSAQSEVYYNYQCVFQTREQNRPIMIY